MTIALLFGKVELTLADSIRYAIKNGELLLLSSSAVSPLLYLVATTKTTKANRFLTSFPHGLFYIVFTLLVIIACAVFITLRAVSGHPPASPNDQIGGTMFPWSLWLYAFSVFLYFTATFHKNAASDADARSLIIPGEAEFGTAWENR
ncbi:hypothetical protein [Brevundimonas sp.]|uniref:hypothetical protein n=1 Tax=Brevundimonas sp. TaxID=1871086 RepID=UPI0027378CF3|nr:hypothetical protein [Brevundimonas sp.]